MLKSKTKLIFIIISLLVINKIKAQAVNDCIFSAIDITNTINAVDNNNQFKCLQDSYSGATQDNFENALIDCAANSIFDDIWFKFTVTNNTPNVWLGIFSEERIFDTIDFVSVLYSGTPLGNCGSSNSLSGLTLIDCADGNSLKGGDRDKAFNSTPDMSRIDLSNLSNGTYYYRVLNVAASYDGRTIFYSMCAEQAVPNYENIDACPGNNIECVTIPNVDIHKTYRNISNVGCIGDVNGTASTEPVPQQNFAGEYDADCTGFFLTSDRITLTQINNTAIYTFDIYGNNGCEPEVLLTFENIKYGYGLGMQFQLVKADCQSDFVYISWSTLASCIALKPDGGKLPNGRYYLILDGSAGDLCQFDLKIDITYSGCVQGTPLMANATSNNPTCVGETLNLTSNTIAGATYRWTGPNGFTSSNQNPTISNIQTAMSGTYTLYIATTNPELGTVCEVEDEVFVSITNIVAPEVVSPVIYCLNSSAVPLSANGNNLKWYTSASGGTASNTAPTPNTTIAGSTTYYVSSQVGNCETSRESIEVLVYSTLPVPVINSNSPVCSGEALIISTPSAVGINYKWVGPNGFTSNQPIITIPNASLMQTGDYTLEVSLGNCGSNTATTSALITPSPIPGFSTNPSLPVTVTTGNHSILISNTATNANEVVWDFGDGQTSTELNPSHVYTKSGKYSIKQTVRNGSCTADTTIGTILVISECMLYIPNAISPNDDGINDKFEITGGKLAQFELKIYDRWGGLIHQSNDISATWDAKIAQQPIKSGTYIYVITGNCDSEQISLSGLINLID